MRSDNNPPSWPPAPDAGDSETAKPRANNHAGVGSLTMVIVGALVLIAEAVTIYRLSTRGFYFNFAPADAVISLVWWVAALALGIQGRRSLAGKIGIGVSLAVIVVGTALLLWLVAQPPGAPVSAPTVPPPPPVE